MTDKRACLKKIIRNKSFRNGTHVLSSGQITNYYLDLKPTMMDYKASAIIAELILEKIADLEIDLVGGIELGAVPLVSSVVALSSLTKTPVNGFIVRKKLKDHGSMNAIEGFSLNESLAGKTVCILEDVTTTGQSVLKVIEECKQQGAHIAIVISVVDRSSGASQLFEEHGIKFESLFESFEFFNKIPDDKPSKGLHYWVAKLLNLN